MNEFRQVKLKQNTKLSLILYMHVQLFLWTMGVTLNWSVSLAFAQFSSCISSIIIFLWGKNFRMNKLWNPDKASCQTILTSVLAYQNLLTFVNMLLSYRVTGMQFLRRKYCGVFGSSLTWAFSGNSTYVIPKYMMLL